MPTSARLISAAWAGKIISKVGLNQETDTVNGAWAMIYEQISLVSLDGTVHPIYTGQTTSPITSSLQSGGETGIGSHIDVNRGKATSPTQTTTYYIADHLGPSRLLASGNGYPIWAGVFLPYGQEWNPQITMNHYKFTGDERDAESNLDHTFFRQYEATQGRWLTPDPARMAAVDVVNPQTLNRYSYVGNNPMIYSDPLGLWHCEDASGNWLDYPQSDCVANNDGWTPDPGDIPGDPSLVFNGPPDSQPDSGPDPQLPGDPGSTTSIPLDSGSSSDNSFEPGSRAYQVFGPPSAATWNSAYSWGEAAFIGTGAVIAAPVVASGVAAAPGVATNIAARGFGWAYGLTGTGTGVVLGRNPEYLDAAQALGAKALNAPGPVFTFFSQRGEWWTLNRAFLNASIFRGQQFFLSNHPLGQEGSTFAQELAYLTSSGIGPEQWLYVPLSFMGF